MTNGVICWVLQCQKDPSNFQIQCIISPEGDQLESELIRAIQVTNRSNLLFLMFWLPCNHLL